MTLTEMLTGVLFIGHSLFGKTGPDMLSDLLRREIPEARVEAQIINGAPLKWNWTHSAEAEGVDARVLLPQGGIGTVILTEAIPLENHLKWSETKVYASRFHALAARARPGTQVLVQETWHSLNSGTGAEVAHDDNADIPWRERLDRDLPKWQGIVDAMNAAGVEGPPVRLIPAGQAMARLHDAIEAGQVSGLDDIRALFSDDIHLNDTGFYFVAMVQYAALTGKSPEGLPTALIDRWGQAFDAPAPDLARKLQQIAWDTVQATGTAPSQVLDVTAPQPPPTPAPPSGPAITQADAANAPGLAPRPWPEGARKAPIGVGLAAVTDWSSELPFLDIMKTARPWIGHLPRRWGGVDYPDLQRAGFLDPDGWPVEIPRELSSIGTLILSDLPPEATIYACRYLLRFDGDGIVEVTGRARNKRYGKNEVRFDFEPGEGGVEIRIQRTDRARTGDYVRNITVVREDHAALLDQGALFNPDWMDRMRGFAALRFMDWMDTNDSDLSSWEDRPKPSDFTWAQKGVPAEVLVALANELDADPWFNMPHLATDTYMRNFAELVRDRLDPARKAYVEFSNEVWNWQFAQARWADEMAIDRWGARDAWVQYYAKRAVEMSRIWTEVFGEAAPDRLVRVIATQTGWLGLEDTILNAPLWVEEGNPPPAEEFDAYAIAGYFSSSMASAGLDNLRLWLTESRRAAVAQADAMGLTGAARDHHIAEHEHDLAVQRAVADLLDGSQNDAADGTVADVLGRMVPYHRAVARKAGLDLIVYEGGTHLVARGSLVEDDDLTRFLIRVNYSAGMGALYDRLLQGWSELGGGLFMHYSSVYTPNRWGSWGALRHLGDDNPRWQALRRALP